MPKTEIGTAERLLDELRLWVECETPSDDAAAVNRLMDRAERELGAVGAALQRISGRDGFGDVLIARSCGEGAPIVVIGHLDTVWAKGTLATVLPWRVEGNKAFGPGIYDMKAGAFMAFHALREILRQNVPTRRPIVLMLTPDEEVGSPISRPLIEREARGAAAVLIPEPAGPGGACVTARKGVGRFVMRIYGVAAHAGGNWHEGRSAVVALAERILHIHALADPAAGITTNVAPIWGGSRPNVVAAEAGCEIDLRVADAAQGERLSRLLHGLAGEAEGLRITVEGGMNRPPMVETPQSLALYERARAIAARQGYALPKMHRGGASDGNFTAAMGVPTLDGLGCTGGGAHAYDEHIIWPDLVPRCATLCELLETLD